MSETQALIIVITADIIILYISMTFWFRNLEKQINELREDIKKSPTIEDYLSDVELTPREEAALQRGK